MARIAAIAFIAMLTALTMLGRGAEIKWLEKNHDLGTMLADGEHKKGTSRFVNTSGQPLTIIEAKTKCVCTQVEFPDSAIVPCDTATISFDFNPHGYKGNVNPTIRLIFDNGASELIRLNGFVINYDNQ